MLAVVAAAAAAVSAAATVVVAVAAVVVVAVVVLLLTYVFKLFFVIFLRSADEVYAALIFDEFSSDDECITKGEKPALPSIAEAETIEANITLREILHNLSSVITDSETCKFNISRNHRREHSIGSHLTPKTNCL